MLRLMYGFILSHDISCVCLATEGLFIVWKFGINS